MRRSSMLQGECCRAACGPISEPFCMTQSVKVATMVDASRPQLQLSHKKCKHFLRHSLCMLLHGHDRAKEVGALPHPVKLFIEKCEQRPVWRNKVVVDTVNQHSCNHYTINQYIFRISGGHHAKKRNLLFYRNFSIPPSLLRRGESGCFPHG